jgi:uncharacterized protein
MLKLVLLAAVVGLAVLWLLKGRRRDGSGTSRRGAEPAKMVACAHCGVHVPQPEAVFDAGGRPYCGEAHRLAGPRA